MERINPFDNLYLERYLGQTEGINSPSKIDEQKTEQKPEEINGIESIPQKSSEDDFVDTSAMIDDTEDFNSSDFNFEDENKSNATNTLESQNSNSNKNYNNQNEEEIEKQVNEFANELLEKQN